MFILCCSIHDRWFLNVLTWSSQQPHVGHDAISTYRWEEWDFGDYNFLSIIGVIVKFKFMSWPAWFQNPHSAFNSLLLWDSSKGFALVLWIPILPLTKTLIKQSFHFLICVMGEQYLLHLSHRIVAKDERVDVKSICKLLSTI